MKILIVDDIQDNLDLLASIVTSMGHSHIQAMNGKEAVELCLSEEPDLIFMDLMMPIEDGLSATSRIKAFELNYWIPIIIVSARDDDKDIVLGLNAGADDYITKPFNISIVKAKIKAIERTVGFQLKEKEDTKSRKLQLKKLADENYAHLELRRVIDQAAIVADTDVQGNITYINDKFSEISGYSPEELLGKNHSFIHSGIHSKEFFKTLWQTISRGNIWQGDICNRAKNGQLYWVRTTIVPFLDQKTGKPVGYRAIRFDITDRKKLESKLAHEKDRAEMTLAAIGDGVIKTDASGQVLFMNVVAETLTGWQLPEAQNLSIDEVFKVLNKSSRKIIENPVHKVIAEKQILSLERNSILVSRDGKEHQIENTTAPIIEDNVLVGCILVIQDVTGQRNLSEKIEWQAWHDTLTSLPNRALLTEKFSISIANANREKTLIAVCLLDIDNFKPINDNFGHEYGDYVLVDLANRLSETVRSGDTLARFGGDEFALLLNGFTEIEEIDATLHRIFKSFALPFTINGESFFLTASIGVTIFPDDHVDSDTLLRHADQAMYQAKKLGKNRFTYFNPSDETFTTDNSQDLTVIKNAIHNNEMVLFYQPKVNMRTGKIIGMEALIRWQHHERGLLGPIEFLPQIEGTDVIVDIGEWVTYKVLSVIDKWSDDEKRDWSISINISAYHFMQPNFVSSLKKALDQYPDVPATCLELEVLETEAINDLAYISDLIKKCQNLGVSFSLDDFGTGYSSLSYLKELPADCLKIDQSFVRDMLDDNDDMALVEGIISLSKVFKRKVIAEGVETAEHGIILMRLGCDYAQGYGIARPMPIADLFEWTQNYKPDTSWSVWSGSKWEMSNLPLVVAQNDHIKWVQEIFNLLEGGSLKLENIEITNHYECRLGSWFYGHGKKHYSHLPSFNELEEVHIAVHKTGHEIISLYNEGKKDEAVAVAEKLLVLKSEVLDKLNILQRQVNFTDDKIVDNEMPH